MSYYLVCVSKKTFRVCDENFYFDRKAISLDSKIRKICNENLYNFLIDMFCEFKFYQ